MLFMLFSRIFHGLTISYRFQMAQRSLGFFEKLANMSGALYRHQASQWPRRSQLLKGVWKRELAPPTQADMPAIKAEFAKAVAFVQSGAYRALTVREALVFTAVGLEITFWFFVGEMIGRRHVYGYLVPADYVSKDTRAAVAEKEAAEKRGY